MIPLFFPVPTLNFLPGSEELFVCLSTTELASLFCLWLPAAVALHGEEIREATPAGLLVLLEEPSLPDYIHKNKSVSYLHSVYQNSLVVHLWLLCIMFSVTAEAGRGWTKA